MPGDQDQKLKRNTTLRSNISEMDLRRQNSFFDNMNIILPGIFERGPQTKPTTFIPQYSQQVSNEEKHGNVFTGFRTEEPQKVQESKTNLTHSYERQCLQYQKYLFDNRIKTIIKRMAIKAYSVFKNEKQGQFFVFPIQRLLVAIAKKMLLNRFELLFLQYVFEQTKWSYDTDCIRKHVNHFKSYLMLPDSETTNQSVKMVQIYILYCAYFSKKSLNELQSDNMFITFTQEVCPRFKEFFSEWTQRLSIFAKINPKQMNAIFKKLTNNYQGDHEEIENYCLIVQEIIDISPAYNADKSGKQKKSRKKKKEPVNSRQLEESEFQQNNDGRSDSNNRLHDVIIQQEDSLDLPPPVFKQKKSSVLSVDLLEAGHYLTRKSSQQSQSDRKF